MQTKIRYISAIQPEQAVITEAAQILQAGGLVVFPTETVYGLGANALDASAVAGIYAAKGRPAYNPVIVHVADAAQAQELVAEWPELAQRLAGRFWPGPLTLVLRRNEKVPDIVTAGGPTVAIRVPAHPVALALIRAAGLPIAAPSANRSMQVSPTQAEHVLSSLNGLVPLILDGGPTSGGIESTVLDVTTDPPRLLRPGLVTASEIEAVIGPLAAPLTPSLASESAAALPSPGMLARHYAPRAPLEVVANSRERVEELRRAGESVGWMTFAEEENPLSGVALLTMPTEAKSYAAQLYAALHTLDALGVTRIVVEEPPHGDDWDAIHDRLRRAAASA